MTPLVIRATIGSIRSAPLAPGPWKQFQRSPEWRKFPCF
jgi:hypothetical protein